MQTRYIKKDNNLYYAVVIDGKYRLPISVVNKSIMQPQYVILSQKEDLYEVMYYSFYQTIQREDYLSPALSKQMFIPLSHVVRVGDDMVTRGLPEDAL